MDESKYNREFVRIAKRSIKEQLSIDDFIKRNVDLLDSLRKAENIIFKATFDLFFLYFPEAANRIKEKDEFLGVLNDLKEFSYHEIAQKLNISESSMGYEFDKGQMELFKSALNHINQIEILCKKFEENLDSTIRKNYPNLYTVAGGILAARLIRLSGSSKELSMMPASKIQILGAEKSMFLEKKKPKYGIIFSHSLISNSKYPGKAAKIVASMISLAIKTDIFSKEDRGEELYRKMKEKVDKVNGISKDNR